MRDAAGLRLSLRGLPRVDEVVVVTDETATEALGFIRAACPGALLVHPTRTGVGNALACGFAASSGDIAVTLNADGSTDPGEIPRYVEALAGGADLALGSRYRDGGRDLTGGRFRRWAGRLLIWLVNVLFGVRRTDPGFGYAAFWRDTIDRLELPDPSRGGPAAWGDGPEFTPLLTVRSAARNLVVAEVGSVAYPRIRRATGDGRTTLRHWLRTITTEYAHRRRTARHAAGPSGSPAFSVGRGGLGRTRPTGIRSVPAQPVKPVPLKPVPAEPGLGTRALPHAGAASIPRNDQRGLDRRAGHASRRARSNDNPESQGWMAGYPSLRRRDIRPRPADDRHPGATTAEIRAGRPAARPDGFPARTGTPSEPTAIGSAFTPPTRQGETEQKGADQRGAGRNGTGPEHREVGIKRRRLVGFQQQPDLRVINGEGGATPKGRGGRLRAVPRENPS